MVFAAYAVFSSQAEAEAPSGEAINVTDGYQIQGGSIEVQDSLTVLGPPNLDTISVQGKVLSIEKQVWLQSLPSPPAGGMPQDKADFIHRYAMAPLQVLEIIMNFSELSEADQRHISIIGSLDENAVIDSCERLAIEAYSTGGWMVFVADRASRLASGRENYVWLNAKMSDGNANVVHCSVPIKGQLN